jgi:glycine cleavage system H lipoate-binding protein
MTVLLVILTFAVFIGIDALLTHRRERAARLLAVAPTPPKLEPVWVAGYLLPEGLYYHRGHTWARPLDADTVAVGLDDFARRLVGRGERLDTPAVGDWLHQGEAAFTVRSDGRAASLVAPLEGEVVEVNPEVKQKPSLVLDDPFGRGWVMKIRARKLGESLRSLLTGSLAHRWMEDARAALDLRLMALSGSVLQDGGEPVRDFARHLADEDWRRLVAEFLLT